MEVGGLPNRAHALAQQRKHPALGGAAIFGGRESRATGKLSRTQPDLPATTELDEAEIEAARLSTQRKPSKAGQVPTIGEVTLWIAELGGYTGKSSGCPPGIIVLTRGLQRIELLAVHLRRTAEHP